MILHATTHYAIRPNYHELRTRRELTDLERVCLSCDATVEVCDATDAGANKGPCPWRARWLDDDAVMSSTCRVAPLDAHKATVDGLLVTHWWLNAREIYDLIVSDGYVGSNPTVRRYVRLRREGMEA